LEQLLVDEEHPEATRLETCVTKEQLLQVAECVSTKAFEAWKYNETKTLEMLEKKVSKVSQYLKDNNVNVTDTAVASNYVKVGAIQAPESISCFKSYFVRHELIELSFVARITGSYTRYAHGIVSEYLPELLSIELAKHLNLPAEEKPIPVLDEVEPPPNKKQKLNNSSEPLEDYSTEVGLRTAKVT